MSRLRLALATLLALTLLAACAPPVFPPLISPSEPATTPACPECQTLLHVVSLYGDPAPIEAEPALHDYAITAQEFSTNHLVATVPRPDAAFGLDAPIVGAIARHVDNPLKPTPLPDANEIVLWRLYLTGAQGRTEISCEPSTDPTSFTTGLVWQEVYANLPAASGGQNVYADVRPVAQVCYLPPAATQDDIGEHAMDANLWVDAAVFDLGAAGFGIYRFEPPEPGNPGGAGCTRYCSIIHCNGVFGCFLRRVCNTVCR